MNRLLYCCCTAWFTGMYLPEHSSRLEYRSVRNHKNKKWAHVLEADDTALNLTLTSAEFHSGDVLEFRCHASPQFYAHGIIWEKRLQNGSTIFERGHRTLSGTTDDPWENNIAELSIQLMTDQLTKISCYVPPWNSTGWVTHSLVITVKDSSAPATESGESFVQENISVFTHKSVTLECGLWGVPEPKYEWNTNGTEYIARSWPDISDWGSSIVVSYDSKQGKFAIGKAGEADLPSLHYLDKNLATNSSIKLGHSEPLSISCVATNVAGNGTKIFRLQAIRKLQFRFLFQFSITVEASTSTIFIHQRVSMTHHSQCAKSIQESCKPEMANVAREAVVIYTGGKNSVLNCTATQGVPTPHFHWQRHGLNISMDENLNGSMWSALVFKHAQIDDGEYTCVASNIMGSISKEFSVRVRDRLPLPSRSSSNTWFLILAIAMFPLLIAMIGFIVYLWYSKKATISRLDGRAEYTKSYIDMDGHQSCSTISTLVM